MSAVDTKFYDKKKQKMLYVSVVFFIFVLLLTGGLYVYNMQLSKANAAGKSELSKIESSIFELEAVDNIQTYKLFKRNQKFLEKANCRSQIPSFITHLRRNFVKYGLEAKGFVLSEDSVSTDISVNSSDTEKAYQKISKFLTQYPEAESSLFSLNHIGDYNWYDRIKFPLSLTFNKNMYEICKK